MQNFFVVLALGGFDQVKRERGYSRAVALLDDVRDAIAEGFPECERPRAHRTTIDFTLCCRSEDVGALFERLHNSLPGELTIAAVPCDSAAISDDIIDRAEAALREAQRDGLSIVMVGRDVLKSCDDQLMEDLRAAISNDRLALHYQPKLCTRTGELAGVEGLVRWNDPVRGNVAPDDFVPVAERCGDIRALTEWVIDRAVADQARLREADIAIPLHINISAPLIADASFIDDALARLGSASGAIGFEITETAMIDNPEGTLANLHRLADAGVTLAIDDYGSGFSSLAYLRRLPVNELKIDRMFIERLSSNPRDPLLVRSTIDLAHALEMKVTAEGVQSAAALALLQVMRCDLVQGYFLSPPLPLSGLLDFMRTCERGSSLPRPATLRERVAERRAGGARSV